MAVPFKIQSFQALPPIFGKGLDPEIFVRQSASISPFFENGRALNFDGLTGMSNHEVVITGQQPGFMGGPLYTLYKIATTISLAQLRTASGLPTVPVFWAGDDDDDLPEAISCQGWDPLLGKLFSANVLPEISRANVLAGMPASMISLSAQKWLVAMAGLSGTENFTALLAETYTRALKEEWNFSKLFCHCIELIFPNSGLIIVRGNDPRIHKIAQPFYEAILPKLSRLQELARADASMAISDRSIDNPLFKLTEGRRQRLSSLSLSWDSSLRPGVLLRSLIQDWVFQPRAVVVGPGEQAYLNQLKPLYEEMKVRRSPLVPRLFATLAPSEISIGMIKEAMGSHKNQTEDLQQWTQLIQTAIAEKLEDILGVKAGLDPTFAKASAMKKAQRMTRNFPDYFEGMQRLDLASRKITMPPWVWPQNHKQERRLAFFNAVALWGTPLVDSVFDAAHQHLKQGKNNNWQEWFISVPSLSWASEKGNSDD